MRTSQRVRRLGRAFTLIGVMIMVFGLMAPTAQADPPPGNNGTVKVDGGELQGQSNEPHVGCDFFIEWFGFDPGATSTVDFTMQSPTDTPTTPGAAVSADYGPYTLDGSGAFAQSFNIFDLLKNFSPHPKQGYHVKLTVETTGSQGADTKYKTFWVQGCQEAVGSVTLDKVVEGDAAPADDPTFAFTVTSDDPGAVLTSPVSMKASDAPMTIATNVSFGSTVTITETSANGATSTSFTVDGGAPTPGPSVDVAVGSETAVAVVATNRFDSSLVGSVTLDKVLAGAVPSGDPTFEFTVTSDDLGAVVTSPVSIKASDAPVIVASNVAIGSKVTITETAKNGATGTSFTVNGGAPVVASSVEVTVSSADAVAVVATNTFEEAVLGSTTTTSRPDEVEGVTLARTGQKTGLMLLIGAGFVAAGLVLVLTSRRLDPTS